jgi:serine/threonine protein kinase
MEDTLIDGRYRLLAALGSGGEARVFRARDSGTGNDVAVRLPLQPGAQITSANPPLFHEAWVRLLHSGDDPEHGAYQAFELLEGPTLGELIRAGTLGPVEWRIFVERSLEAVAALHAADWIHGDLNADNFLLAAPGWKLLELPFLRFDPPPGRSMLFGSIHTLAPEQIDGARPDVRSDLYALGCLYYCAAAGVYPHPGATSQEIAIHCLRFPAHPLQDAAPLLPAPWSDGVMNLIATRPNDRPQSIAAARHLLGLPVA